MLLPCVQAEPMPYTWCQHGQVCWTGVVAPSPHHQLLPLSALNCCLVAPLGYTHPAWLLLPCHSSHRALLPSFHIWAVCQGQAESSKFMNILLCFVVSGCSLLFHSKGAALNYLCSNLYLHLHWSGQFEGNWNFCPGLKSSLQIVTVTSQMLLLFIVLMGKGNEVWTQFKFSLSLAA